VTASPPLTGLRPETEGASRPAPVAAVRARRLPALSGVWLGLAGLAILFALWWLGTELLTEPGSFGRRFSPASAVPALTRLLLQPDLQTHILVSLKRVLVGLGIALVIGVPVGLLIGSHRRIEVATTPALQFLRMISPLSWMPIVVMVFGVGDAPVYFLLAFAAVWPILLNTAAGVRQLDPHWLQLSRSLAATPAETLFRVVLPGVLGNVLTGIRLAIGIVWIVLVPCEMLGVTAGLGYFILDTRDRLAYPELMATVLLIGGLGFLLDALARALHGLWAPGARMSARG